MIIMNKDVNLLALNVSFHQRHALQSKKNAKWIRDQNGNFFLGWNLLKTETELKATGGEVDSIVFNITGEQDRQKLAKYAIGVFGSI